MPAKHSRKIYIADTYYHVYNRGVEKRIIFQDEQDYKVFLTYLKQALSPPPDKSILLKNFSLQGLAFKGVPRQPKNFSREIQLIAFCLMPNHFHFLIKQNSKKSMTEFVQSILTRYTMYVNKKYKRVGALFQGRYKAITIDSDDYFLHVSRYIHRNPIELGMNIQQAYSSYATYLGKNDNSWLTTEPLLAFFQKKQRLPFFKPISTYKSFVEQVDSDENILPDELTLELL